MLPRVIPTLWLCAVATAAFVRVGAADQTSCQKQILKQLLKYEKNVVKVHTSCLHLENLGKVPGPCPDAVGLTKIADAATSTAATIAGSCTSADLTGLGFSSSCGDYGSGATAAGAACAGLPAGNPGEVAACLQCWKAAELGAYVAALYASHAIEVCGAVDGTSAECQPLACATPLPDQRNLGESGGDSTCQKGVGTAGFKTMLKRSKVLIKCALAGTTRADCLADPLVQEKLAALETKMATLVQNKCGNRDPEPSPAFCCRTGAGNECTAASTRDDCTLLGFTIQEDKFCDVDSTCASLGGNKQFTWWATCPDGVACAGPALGTTDDMSGCVDGVADRLVDRLLCLQVPRNGGADWPCPASPSGAFVD